MKKIVILLLIVFGFYHWYSKSDDIAKAYGEPHNDLIMYSLTTCGYCKQKAEQLRSERIKFIEYFIDKDQTRRSELHRKLDLAGFKPKSYGTPIFDVHGVMIPNNPDISVIQQYLYSEN